MISRLGVGYNIAGNRIIRIVRGRPIIEGVVKEVNRFSFILFLRVCAGWFCWLVWGLSCLGSGI